ncbi:hypothetical protein ABMA28_003068 [Loxostege sticticalis]|uniref:Zinc finger DNA binding protein n=1 Tax=Loxostege sticticalis TaxID=481309 RepID=A0ABD0SUX4_LOXSC
MELQRTPPNNNLHLVTKMTPTHSSSEPDLNRLDPEDYINITKRQKRTFEEISETLLTSQSQSSSQSPVEVTSMLVDIKAQQEMLNMAMTTLLTQNLEIKKTVETITNQHQELLQKFSSLQQENKEYKTRVVTLESKLEQIEKNTCCSKVEMRNIPKQNNESKQTLTKLLQTIGSTLGIETPIEDSEIRDIYRTKPGTIVVDFTTTARKETLLSETKKYNKNKRANNNPQLDTAQINLQGPTHTIYISEALTTKSRRLFFVAREYVKNKKLSSAWTAYGKIYVKLKEDAIPTLIKEEEYLHKLVK